MPYVGCMTEREANVALSMKDVVEAVRKRVAAIEADASVVRTAEAHELLMVSHDKWVKDLLTSSNGLDHLATIALKAILEAGERAGVPPRSVFEDMQQLP